MNRTPPQTEADRPLRRLSSPNWLAAITAYTKDIAAMIETEAKLAPQNRPKGEGEGQEPENKDAAR